MTTATDGGVDDRALRDGTEELDHLPAQDRAMDERLTHRYSSRTRSESARSPPIGQCRPDFSPGSARSKAGGVGAFDRANRGTASGPEIRVLYLSTR